MTTKKIQVGASNINPSPVQAGSNQEVGSAVQPTPGDPASAQGAWAAIVLRIADLPPATPGPTPPFGTQVPTAAEQKSLVRVTRVQKAHTAGAIRELQQGVQAGTYDQRFRTWVPGKLLTSALQRALLWGTAADAAARWNAYARSQSRIAWDDALTLVSTFGQAFETAAGFDSALATTEMPATASLVRAHGDSVRRGVLNRARALKAGIAMPSRRKRTVPAAPHAGTVPAAPHAPTTTGPQGQGPAVNQGPAPSSAATLQGPAVNPQGPAPGR